VAHVGRLAEEREGGVGVLFEDRQLQAEDLLRVLEGELVDAGRRVGELTGRGGELLVVLVVHGDLLRSMTARSCRLVRCTIQGALLRCNIFRTIHRRAFRKKAESMTYRESPGVAAARSAG